MLNSYFKERRASLFYLLLFFVLLSLPLVASAGKDTKTRAGDPNQTQDFVTDTLPNGFYYLNYFGCDMFVDRMAFKIISKEDRTVELSRLCPAEMWGDRWIYKMDTMRIPETVTWNDTTYTVVGIGSCALQYAEINHIEFPKTIKYLKQFAFNACEGLKELRLPAHITRYEDYAFCGAIFDRLEFPESIEYMGTGMFCKLYPGAEGARIGKLILPRNLERLPASMFYAAHIRDLTIPESVKGNDGSTSESTQIDVLRMEHKDPPSWLLTCDTLVVPDGYKNAYLRNFKVGDSFKVICETSEYEKMNVLFEKDGLLYRIPTQDGDTVIAVKAYNEDAVIPAVTKFDGRNYTVVEVALSQDEPIRSLKMAKGIRRLGAVSNTKGLSALEKLELPGTIKEIPLKYFMACNGLKEVSLSEGLEVIGSRAFENAILTDLSIPASVRRIDGPVCYVRKDGNCLDRIVVTEGNKVYQSGKEHQALIETATGRLIQGCADFIVPEGVRVIGNGAFCQKKLYFLGTDREHPNPATDIILPQGLEEIEGNAFTLDAIGTLYIPNCLKSCASSSIETSAIRSIVLEDGTGTLSLNSFGRPVTFLEIFCWPYKDVLNIESVYYGKNTSPFVLNCLIPQAGARYFDTILCDTLTIGPMVSELPEVSNDITFNTIHSLITNPDDVVPHFTPAIYAQTTLFVPQGTKEKYQNATGWKEFETILEVGETAIGGITTNAPTESARFSLDGRRLTSPQKGINIIRRSDGTTRKEFVK